MYVIDWGEAYGYGSHGYGASLCYSCALMVTGRDGMPLAVAPNEVHGLQRSIEVVVDQSTISLWDLHETEPMDLEFA